MPKIRELRRRLLAGERLEDRELVMLLWGGDTSSADVVGQRLDGLFEATGDFSAWVSNLDPETLRQHAVGPSRSARLLAAVELARRNRTAPKRDFETTALAALELVKLALRAIAENPTPDDIAKCVDMIDALQRSALHLGVRPAAPAGWVEKILKPETT